MDVPQKLMKSIIVGSIMVGLGGSIGQVLAQDAPAENKESTTRAGTSIADILMQPSPLGDIVLGKEDAKVTIVEFSSLTCSHCGAFHKEVFPKIKEKYIDTGLVKVIFRDLSYDPLAAAGYMLARCKGNDNFFNVIDHFFQKQNDLFKAKTGEESVEVFMKIAKEAGFSNEDYMTCVADERLLNGLKAVRDQATALNISGTPTLFIDGNRVVGYKPFEGKGGMEELIETALKAKAAQ